MMQADAARKRLYMRLHDIYHKGDPLCGGFRQRKRTDVRAGHQAALDDML